MPVDSDTFRTLLSRFPTGVTIVTARDSLGRPHGMTVSAFCSVSLEPPQVLICIERTASMAPVLQDVTGFAVSILADEQEYLSRRFSNDDDTVRFEGIAQRNGVTGAPLLDAAHATIECEITARYDGGDHEIVVGLVIAGEANGLGRPLVYYRGNYVQLER